MGPTRRRRLRPRILSATRLAVAFLTVIPQRTAAAEPVEADLAASRFAYPLVGAAIGLVMAATSEACRRLGAGPELSAFLLVSALTLLSGGLHLDGLADTFDGLFLWGGPERRLAVMRDPHVGSHGVTAIVLLLLGQFAALNQLNGRDRAVALLGAVMVSRTLILVAAGIADYARPQGTGRHVVEAAGPAGSFVAAMVAVAVSSLLAGWVGLCAGLASLVVAVGLARLAAVRLGGITGDILGAVVELGELSFLVIFGLAQGLEASW